MERIQNRLCESLFGEKLPRSVAVFGSGGKTSTVCHLADEYEAKGYCVIITPTTKMGPPQDRTLLAQSAEEALRIAEKRGRAYIGTVLAPIKMSGLPLEERETLFRPGVVVISEADGARMLPMKAAAPYEPVIPADADGLLLVFGLDAIGKPLCEVCHRYELLVQQFGVRAEETVTPALAAENLRYSYLNRFPERKMLLLFNKCDGAARLAAAEEMAALLSDYPCFATKLL